MTKDNTDRAHAILSPSFMHIALKCAGSVGLKEKLPPSPPNPASIKGTAIHKAGAMVLESYLNSRENGTCSTITGKVLFGEEEIADIAYQWMNIIWQNVFEASITGKAYGVEERLTYNEKLSLWGTADFYLIATDERAKRYGYIADLKTGRIEVEADNNPQLADYAVSLRQEIRNLGKDLDYVKCSIFQPYASGDKYKETKFTSKQLDTWEKKFLKLADEVYSGKAKFKVGEHCRHCPGQTHCALYAKTLSKETSLALIDPTEIVFPEPTSLPDGALVKIALNQKNLDTFVKACKKRILERLYNGEKIEGIKAVEGKGRRKLDEAKEDVLEEFCAQYKIIPYSKKLKGIGELEKELTPALGVKEAKLSIDRFTLKSPPPILLVSPEDARPGIQSKLELLDNIDLEE